MPHVWQHHLRCACLPIEALWMEVGGRRLNKGSSGDDKSGIGKESTGAVPHRFDQLHCIDDSH
jgi:hypothetical protein